MDDPITAAYKLAERPFIEAPGPIPADKLYTKSWRYFVELNTACNLRCVLCTVGNRKGYEYKAGVMDFDLFLKILDKIQSESPGAVICTYGNSEPFLYPRLDEVVAQVRSRGLRCEVSTNGNYVENLEKVVRQKPDLLQVSLSGFTQEVYVKHHVGGNIETVKENLKLLAKIRDDGNQDVHMGVSYHMYRDNLGDEMQRMKDFAEGLGFQWLLSWARAISMEPLIQALRKIDQDEGNQVDPYGPWHDGSDLNTMLPPPSPEFLKNLDNLNVHPKNARRIYERFPVSTVCFVGHVFTYIRHDGLVELCACCNDRRLIIGRFLEMTPQQMVESRWGHPFCKECLKYRTNLYFQIVDPEKWNG